MKTRRSAFTRILVLTVLLVAFGLCAVSAIAEGGELGKVTIPMLNVRSRPWTAGTVDALYKEGDVIEILEKTEDDWGRTELGWVNLRYVEMGQTGEASIAPLEIPTGYEHLPCIESGVKYAYMGIILGTPVDVYASADSSGDIVGYYNRYDRVGIVEYSGAWMRTSCGWVKASQILVEGSEAQVMEGTVTCSMLSVFSGPGAQYERMRNIPENSLITIKAVLGVGEKLWGYTHGGWVNMEFVEFY